MKKIDREVDTLLFSVNLGDVLSQIENCFWNLYFFGICIFFEILNKKLNCNWSLMKKHYQSMMLSVS